jgi:hypothetical protein
MRCDQIDVQLNDTTVPGEGPCSTEHRSKEENSSGTNETSSNAEYPLIKPILSKGTPLSVKPLLPCRDLAGEGVFY